MKIQRVNPTHGKHLLLIINQKAHSIAQLAESKLYENVNRIHSGP